MFSINIDTCYRPSAQTEAPMSERLNCGSKRQEALRSSFLVNVSKSSNVYMLFTTNSQQSKDVAINLHLPFRKVK